MKLPLQSQDLSGRVVIVTGSNIGLGFEGRLVSCRDGYYLTLYASHSRCAFGQNETSSSHPCCLRDIAKGERASQSILKMTSTSSEVWKLDLGDFASVKAFAKRANTELDRLDIFLENAGMASQKHVKTKDGYEQM